MNACVMGATRVGKQKMDRCVVLCWCRGCVALVVRKIRQHEQKTKKIQNEGAALSVLLVQLWVYFKGNLHAHMNRKMEPQASNAPVFRRGG